MSKIEDYGCNVAAITSLFCLEPGKCQAIQEECGEALTGDVGLWEVFASAGLVFTQEEASLTEGLDYYWHEAIEAFTGKLMVLLLSGQVPDKRVMRRMAWESIGEYLIAPEDHFSAEMG